MSSTSLVRLCCGVLLAGCLAVTSSAQEGPEEEAEAMPVAEPQMGPATIAPHWSKYEYPESVPEGTPYHIIEKGDTLWDLAASYLGDPYLWPQIWERNPYIRDSHWIYPGDPVAIDIADRVLAKLETLKGRVVPGDVEVTITRNYGETADHKVDELVEGLLGDGRDLWIDPTQLSTQSAGRAGAD